MDIEKMIEQYTPLIKMIAWDLIKRRNIQSDYLDDLIQCGRIGVFQSLDKFDPTRNISFKTYVEHRIKGEMNSFLRNNSLLSKSDYLKMRKMSKMVSDFTEEHGRKPDDGEIIELLGITEEQFYSEYDCIVEPEFVDIETIQETFVVNCFDSVIEKMNGEDLNQIILEAMQKLNAMEKDVINQYYFNEMTLEEIGEKYNVTREYIRQIRNNAFVKLKKYFHGKSLADFI